MMNQISLRDLSEGAFANLGIENIAYIRSAEIEDVRYFVLMSALGEELAVAANYEAVLAAADDHGLDIVTLN